LNTSTLHGSEQFLEVFILMYVNQLVKHFNGECEYVIEFQSI
jgi:hypothetical protein